MREQPAAPASMPACIPLLPRQLMTAETWGCSWALHPVSSWQYTEAAQLPGPACAAHSSTMEPHGGAPALLEAQLAPCHQLVPNTQVLRPSPGQALWCRQGQALAGPVPGVRHLSWVVCSLRPLLSMSSQCMASTPAPHLQTRSNHQHTLLCQPASSPGRPRTMHWTLSAMPGRPPRRQQ